MRSAAKRKSQRVLGELMQSLEVLESTLENACVRQHDIQELTSGIMNNIKRLKRMFGKRHKTKRRIIKIDVLSNSLENILRNTSLEELSQKRNPAISMQSRTSSYRWSPGWSVRPFYVSE